MLSKLLETLQFVQIFWARAIKHVGIKNLQQMPRLLGLQLS